MCPSNDVSCSWGCKGQPFTLPCICVFLHLSSINSNNKSLHAIMEMVYWEFIAMSRDGFHILFLQSRFSLCTPFYKNFTTLSWRFVTLSHTTSCKRTQTRGWKEHFQYNIVRKMGFAIYWFRSKSKEWTGTMSMLLN